MISVAIIGLGNVGSHLYHTFNQVDKVEAIQVNSRNLKDIPNVDITIIAVSDDAIAEVSSQLTNSLVVHTSGGASLLALKNKGRKGVFYPLQTFSKDKTVDFSTIPICLEAENDQDTKLLEELALTISTHIYHINSEQRKSIHASAVFVNNFVNHIYTMAYDICNTHQVPFKILQPLIQETANKIQHLSPKEAQTGPAIRNDVQTIQNHLHLLNKQQQEIYTKLTQSIQEYGKKL
jgi:predicted short-subunit dehydrogenase-like oxidoreductase (DUF2520 family)